jgi:cryptochrome
MTGQLFWRDYFYIMSVPNQNFDRMKSNPICLNIPWSNDASAKEKLKQWKEGRTGYPFIDAGMRQLVEEGWLHHVTRNAVACFLTRSDLWISWEKGLKHFLKSVLLYLKLILCVSINNRK